MSNDFGEENDEVVQSYIQEYQLDDGLPAKQKKQAVFLIGCIRKLRRMRFEDRQKALEAYTKTDRWLAESQVFHPYEHVGYNRLLDHVRDSLHMTLGQIDDKFPEET